MFLESHDRVKYCNGKYFGKKNIKVEKNEDENFQLFMQNSYKVLKIWSQKVQSFLIIKIQFLFWFIRGIQKYKREFEGI